MDYSVSGLPLHVLLVHVVIVAVPLLVLALVVAAAWPAARRVLWLPCLVAAVGLLPLTLVTIEAGKWLQQRVPPAPLIAEHTGQGESIVPWVIGLLVVAAVVGAWAVTEWVVRRRAGRVPGFESPSSRASGPAPAAAIDGSGSPVERRTSLPRSAVVAASAVLTVAVLAVGAGAVWTLVGIGESGSRAVWEGSFSDEPLQ